MRCCKPAVRSSFAALPWLLSCWFPLCVVCLLPRVHALAPATPRPFKKSYQRLQCYSSFDAPLLGDGGQIKESPSGDDGIVEARRTRTSNLDEDARRSFSISAASDEDESTAVVGGAQRGGPAERRRGTAPFDLRRDAFPALPTRPVCGEEGRAATWL